MSNTHEKMIEQLREELEATEAKMAYWKARAEQSDKLFEDVEAVQDLSDVAMEYVVTGEETGHWEVNVSNTVAGKRYGWRTYHGDKLADALREAVTEEGARWKEAQP